MGYSKTQKALINKAKSLQLRLSPDVTVNDMTINQISKQLNLIHREAIGKSPGDTFTGGVIEFDRHDELLLLLSVTLSPEQSGSGEPSLSNIRPIIGYNAVTVYVRGFNQWDETWEIGGISGGNDSVQSDRIRSKNMFRILPNTSYYLKTPLTYTGNFWISYYTADGVYIAGDNQAGTAFLKKNSIFITPANACYARFQLTQTAIYNNDICINFSGEGNGKYEPYNPASADYSISFPQPVYSGTVNVLTGEINSTWALIDNYAGEAMPGEWISDRDVYTPGGVPSSGAQVCYKLETPETSYTTGADVILLDGYNAIWSPEGETEAIIL